MSFDTKKVRGRIVEMYGTLQNFCKENSYSYSTLQTKLKGKSYFTQEDIMNFLEWLSLDRDDIVPYFFNLLA